jgi:hypothetical protein
MQNIIDIFKTSNRIQKSSSNFTPHPSSPKNIDSGIILGLMLEVTVIMIMMINSDYDYGFELQALRLIRIQKSLTEKAVFSKNCEYNFLF